MATSPKITLEIPREGKSARNFYFKLKTEHLVEQSEYNQPEKMVVVSDIEGNYEQLRKLLILTGVINRQLKWVFGDNHLVILGDAFDRGEQVIECIWFIYALEEKANRKGGHVHYILGNHEIMNLNGDWRYVHPKYAIPKNNANNAVVAIYQGNHELWEWLCTKNIVEKVGHNLFVHGGIAPEILQYNLSVEEMNNLARPSYRHVHEPISDPLLFNLINSPISPVWYRGYYDGTTDEKTIDNILDQFGAKTIITGHSMVEKISCFFDRKVINVDTDHAAAESQALIIEDEKYYRIGLKEKKTRIK